MLVAKLLDEKIVVGTLRQFFPTTSFPSVGPSGEWLKRQGVFRVVSYRDFDPKVQKLVPVEPYLDGDVVYSVAVQEKSQEDLAEELKTKEQEVRSERDRKLSETDWRFRSDLSPSQEWVNYCQALRDIPQQQGFPLEVVWPTKPA